MAPKWLTEEELDFIVNYDVKYRKYRLGAATDEEG